MLLNTTRPPTARRWIALCTTLLVLLVTNSAAWALDFVPAATALPVGYVGEDYETTIQATGGQAPYTFEAAGSIATGLRYSANEQTGTIILSGEPRQSGNTFYLDITATDANQATIKKRYTLLVLPSRSMRFSPTSIDAIEVGDSLEVTFVGEKGEPPYQFQILTGSLPPGVGLSGDRLTGAATEAGRYAFTVQMYDRMVHMAVEQSYVIEVGAPPQVDDVEMSVVRDGGARDVPLRLSGNVSQIRVVDAPSQGTVEQAGLSLSYTPAAGFVGRDAFTVVASNAFGVSAPARVGIAVVAVDELPIAGDTSVTLLKDADYTPLPLALSGPAASHVSISRAPQNGQVQMEGTQIRYKPRTGFVGQDTLSYRAHLGSGASAPGEVVITVADTLDAPIAHSGAIAVLADSGAQLLPVRITGHAADAVQVIAGPTHGSATVQGLDIRYTPAAGFVGVDSLQYTATNAAGTSAPARIDITVMKLDTLPTADDVSFALLMDSDFQQVPLALSGPAASHVSVARSPQSGEFRLEGTRLYYKPNAGFTGQDTLSYRAHRGSGASAPAEVRLSVTAALAPPVAAPSQITLSAGAASTTLPVQLSGHRAQSLRIESAAQHGSITVDGLKLLYTPNTGFIGNDSLHYVASNVAGDSPPTRIDIQVVASGELVYTLDVIAGRDGQLTLVRPELGAPIAATTLGQVSPAQAGRVRISGDTVTFQADATFAGAASVPLTILLSNGQLYVARLDITVRAAVNTIDEDVLELVRVQQDQAYIAAAFRGDQVAGRQGQLHSSNDRGLWLSGIGGDARRVRGAYQSHLRGQSMGWDGQIGPGYAGVALDRLALRTPFGLEGTSKLLSQGISAYGGIGAEDGWRLNGQIGIGRLQYTSQRTRISGEAVGGKRDGYQWHARTSASRVFQRGALQFGAAGDVDLQWHRLEALHEVGDQGYVLHGEDQRGWSVAPAIRVWVERASSNRDAWRPRLELVGRQRWSGWNDAVLQAWEPGGSASATEGSQDRDYFYWNATMGLERELAPGVSVRLLHGVEFGIGAPTHELGMELFIAK